MDKPGGHEGEENKTFTNEQRVHDSIYMRYLKLANSQKQNRMVAARAQGEGKQEVTMQWI